MEAKWAKRDVERNLDQIIADNKEQKEQLRERTDRFREKAQARSDRREVFENDLLEELRKLNSYFELFLKIQKR